MSRYQSIGLSLLPERLEKIDARAKELGITRSKYIQALVDADLDGGLLDCTIDAREAHPVVKVKEGVSVMVLNRKSLESLSVDLIVNAFKTLGKSSHAVQEAVTIGAVRLAAKQAVRNNTTQ